METYQKIRKDDGFYTGMAKLIADRSYDEQTQVGCVLVKEDNILAYGYNGTPSGTCNDTRDSDGNTRPDVIHAEANALMKLARDGGSSDGATAYTTHSPCMHCSLLLLQAGVKRIVYLEEYNRDSLDFLDNTKIDIHKHE